MAEGGNAKRPIGDSHRLSDLRIVLLGYRAAGKSSAGNTILNREEFELKRTAQCVKRQREVAERHITVVEAPGWWIDVPVEESTELLKQEIVLSVSLCPPGPHAVLLVIRFNTRFKEKERNVLEGHMKLLLESVWSHTIVLFTCGDYLGDTHIEQHIESEGKDLQWLVEKCGNRYHVLNNKNRSDDSQVTELLEKIEEMVAANSGRHFEMDRKILQEVEEKRRAEEVRVKERMMKVQKRREEMKSQMSDSHRLSDLRIVLLGYRDAGKSSAGNTILNREEFELKTTAQCVKRQREVAERHITVVEAPGWWRDVPVEESTELLKQEIVLSVSLCPREPHAVLLVIPVDRVFKEKERNVLEGHMRLLLESVWSHTIVLFTCGDCLGDTPIEQHIEREGKDLQWLVEKCGNRYHVLNNKNRSDDSQVTELLEKIEEMVAANSGHYFRLQGMGRKTRSKVLKRRAERLRSESVEKKRRQSSEFEEDAAHLRLTSSSEEEHISEPPDLSSRGEHSEESAADQSTTNIFSQFPRIRFPEMIRLREIRSHFVQDLQIEPPVTDPLAQMDDVESPISVANAAPPLGCAPPLEETVVNPSEQQSTVVFVPEVARSEIKNNDFYRLLCPHAGQFQCRVTNLMFEMEDKGEVLYRIDFWDERLLDGLGQMQPAGPLYNIDCFEGSISRLHLPHCEIQYGENQGELAVAHLTGDNIEVIRPLKVTHTHVVISIQGLSFFGVLKRMITSASPITGQVLLFFKEIIGKKHRKKLHVHLLPGNVPVEEVKKQHMDFRIIKTSSKCQLIPGKKYRPSCDPYMFQPTTEKFDCDYGPNYHPTFEVFLNPDTEDFTIGLLKDNGEVVWDPRLVFLAVTDPLAQMDDVEKPICVANAAPLLGCAPPLEETVVNPSEQQSTVVFVPEVARSEIKNNDFYRLLCPHAGQFQCRVTNLMFEMEDKGEVLYRIDFWDDRLLDGLGQMQPAGPLYNIDCFEGSISRLHLPHCEIQYGENQGELAVAHLTGDNIEVISPLNVTHTHVVISIQGLSFFGVLKRMITSASPINGQVLLFFKEIIGKKHRKKLHVHLLPGNVPVEEVKKQHMDFRIIKTSSKCQLIPGKKYRPSCDPYMFQPTTEKFDCDYGPNYHPTFEVFLNPDTEDFTIGLLKDSGEVVWDPRLVFLADDCTEEPPCKTDSAGAEFVDENRETLIQKVSSVMEIADCLQSKDMITDEQYSNIQTGKTSQEQMRILYKALASGGTAVKEEFYEVLKKKQPFLIDELEAGPSKA